MNSFINFFQSNFQLDDEEMSFISSLTRYKEYPAKTVLLPQGKIETHLSFIEKGSARYFYIDPNGREISLLFTFENWFLGEMSSFLTQTPSFCFIESLTEMKLWQISYDSLQSVYQNIKDGEKIGRLIMEQLYLRKAERERSFLTQSAEQRYLALLKQNPYILQQIQLKHIASYLGITPQALSRIRRRIN